MTPFEIFVLSMTMAALATFFCWPRSKSSGIDHPTPLDPAGFEKMRERFRDGGIVAYWLRNAPPVFGKRKPSIFLTPRQLERVNIQRKLQGRTPLNRWGFTNAAAHAARVARRTGTNQPTTVSDWLTYLLLYETKFADHSSGRVYVDTGLTITPEAPFNGHGGDFLGAGSAGAWKSPDATTVAAAKAILSDPTRAVEPAITGNGYHFTGPDKTLYATIADPLSDRISYKGSTDDHAPSEMNPDPDALSK
jgi:hypothetical protein